ncbi:45593_t:CDS:2 [Gigaspora margarita]|uniref:45593_t:CDS:1 n=1 Tax=Gigaspora margarita TaxID=4874 RepID=A0ABM8VX72_GIGMA|nr:45593_t:CDS:2 [Gigaspora margarita]
MLIIEQELQTNGTTLYGISKKTFYSTRVIAINEEPYSNIDTKNDENLLLKKK